MKFIICLSKFVKILLPFDKTAVNLYINLEEKYLFFYRHGIPPLYHFLYKCTAYPFYI